MYIRDITIKDLEPFIDFSSSEWQSWDKSDCGLVGLIKVLLIQELKKLHKQPYGDSEHQDLYKFFCGREVKY